jgi:DNA repair protein RecO (recombination protein O)
VPSYRAHALVLKKTKLGETDAILNMLADDGCQLRGVAKGLRKPGSKLGGVLEPFTEARLLMHTGRNLDVISEAEVADAHAALREDLDRLSAASAVADVLDKLSIEGQSEERLFGLGQATLSVCDVATVESLPAVVAAFLVKALSMHGYRPELESCAACASDVTGGHLFSLDSGGVLCPECGGSDTSVLHFSEEARRCIARYLRSRMAEVPEMDIEASTVSETLRLTRDFAEYHVPVRMKALDMYVGQAG